MADPSSSILPVRVRSVHHVNNLKGHLEETDCEGAQSYRITYTPSMSTTSRIEELLLDPVKDGAIMRMILSHISPWDCSPYHLRRVCKSFKGFYVKYVWSRLLQHHLSGTVEEVSRCKDMTIEEVRHLCNFKLQAPFREWMDEKGLNTFKASKWTVLRLHSAQLTAPPAGRVRAYFI